MLNRNITKDNLFKSAPPAPRSKGDITDRAAWTIIDKDFEEYTSKTERLRKARLDMEAEREPMRVPAKPRQKKSVSVRRGKSSM